MACVWLRLRPLRVRSTFRAIREGLGLTNGQQEGERNGFTALLAAAAALYAGPAMAAGYDDFTGNWRNDDSDGG